MFKKSLIAAAVMATVSVPAFAKVVVNDPLNFTTTTLAAVTKQPVLSFSTAQQDVSITFDRLGDIKQNGFITLELSNGATFNAAEVRNWLTFDKPTPLVSGIDVFAAATTTTGYVSVNDEGYPVNAADLLVDATGAVITDTTNASGTTDYSALEAASQLTADAAKAGLTTAAVGAPAKVAVTDMFRVDDVNTNEQMITHAIDQDGKRLRLALVDNGFGADSVLARLSNNAPFIAGTQVDFLLTSANQIFNLQSGSDVQITLKVGALRNASYTADPVATPTLFELGDLFALEKTASTNAIALVAQRFAQWSAGTNNVSSNGLKLVNKTTNQNIQLDKVFLSIEGDFSGFNIDANTGELLDNLDNGTGWIVDNGVATKKAGTDVLEGNITKTASEALNFTLAVKADNEAAIEAQSFKIKAEIFGEGVNSQDTFNYFPAELGDVVVVTRDGMKFDTITTGTTAANQIFVRDISGILPEAGGKIYVTIVEYDQHGVNGSGNGNVLVERAPLTTTLPSNGAVTLSPADVAAEVGAAITPARQARFVFEVETNKGEVAVKKSNSEGVDIQNGTKGVEILKGGNVVDFTL